MYWSRCVCGSRRYLGHIDRSLFFLFLLLYQTHDALFSCYCSLFSFFSICHPFAPRIFVRASRTTRTLANLLSAKWNYARRSILLNILRRGSLALRVLRKHQTTLISDWKERYRETTRTWCNYFCSYYSWIVALAGCNAILERFD